MKKPSKNIVACKIKFSSIGKMVSVLLMLAFFMTVSCPVKKLAQLYSEKTTAQTPGGKLNGKTNTIAHYATAQQCVINKAAQVILLPSLNVQNIPTPDDCLFTSGSSIHYYLSLVKEGTYPSFIDSDSPLQSLPLFLAHQRLLI